MKKSVLVLAAIIAATGAVSAQTVFPQSINPQYSSDVLLMPPSPLKTQILFVGGVDKVQTVDSNGDPNGDAVAKQWHDFVGFTPDNSNQSLGWVSVNHERVSMDDKIGDGGGMTVFRVKRNADSLEVVPQTLADGRSGKFFNVDFVNTVGETGMNCGGIVGPDGRIWTAEEWGRKSNAHIYSDGSGIRDTADYSITNSGISFADGQSIEKYKNLNYMVEIDPKQAKAIRKQYNWGRWDFEGGAILNDNKTVFLGVDATPSFFMKFVAETAGDFTKGNLYLYKEDASEKWLKVNNSSMNDIFTIKEQGVALKATMYNRIEWVQADQNSNAVYFTETGRDNPAGRWADEFTAGAKFAEHHTLRAAQQGTTPDSSSYTDYYGRVMKYDLDDNSIEVYLSGGPEYAMDSVPMNLYPEKHLSNPDGLHIMKDGDKSYMFICEDLNGASYGRVPEDVASGKTCELWFLDMAIQNPTIDDLIRITAVPTGAEVTGAISTNDGKTLLVSSQHPSSDNPYPYNNSLTLAIHGWKDFLIGMEEENVENNKFQFFPNPASRQIQLSEVMDVAIYNALGARVKVFRNVKNIDVSSFAKGTYFLKANNGAVQKLIVQ
jgi:secreted PhoX family phosphatase